MSSDYSTYIKAIFEELVEMGEEMYVCQFGRVKEFDQMVTNYI